MVAFGDISGFTPYLDSVTNKRVEYYPLMDAIDNEIENLRSKTGYQFMDTGDGFMCVVLLPSGDISRSAARVLVNLWGLLKKILTLIEQRLKKGAAPSGFRIVASTGFADLKLINGRAIYRGKHINHAHDSLNTARGHGLVCDVNLKISITNEVARKAKIRFTQISEQLWKVTVGR